MGSRPSHSTGAGTARSVKSVPRPRRPSAQKQARKLPAAEDDLLLDDTGGSLEESLSDAWSLLDCAGTCLDVLAQNSDYPPCRPCDVGLLVRRAVELIRKAKEVVDLGGAP